MLNKTKPPIENDGSRRRPVASVGVLALAVLLTAALIVTASSAAFFDTTANTGNNWSAGTVILNDDAASAMFIVSDMAPLATVTECIVVTYSGSLLPSDVNLYGVSGGTGLDAYLDVTVEEGTGGIFGDCSDGAGFSPTSTIFTGTLTSFAATHTNFANCVGAWNPAANPESRVYRFTVTLQDNNLAQGLDATATFTWEAQA